MNKFYQHHHKLVVESLEKSNLLKESLKIVDELGELDPEDYVFDETIGDLIVRARNLKKNRHWKL